MDKLARLPAQDRRDIFSEAAAQLGIRPTIIEKDFWVCVGLKLLFLKSRFGKSLVFKGGTSLSKAHGLIERFSEDIDLVLDWKIIGFGEGVKDPLQKFDSKSKQDQFNKEINHQGKSVLSPHGCPPLFTQFGHRHYYDLYKLAVSPVRDSAFAQSNLLQDVVVFKQRFYPSARARYDLAVPGTFKLLPTAQSQLADLKHDYQQMQVMLFGKAPDFGSLLDELRKLEADINSIAQKT